MFGFLSQAYRQVVIQPCWESTIIFLHNVLTFKRIYTFFSINCACVKTTSLKLCVCDGLSHAADEPPEDKWIKGYMFCIILWSMAGLIAGVPPPPIIPIMFSNMFIMLGGGWMLK